MQNSVVRSLQKIFPVRYQKKLGDTSIGSSGAWNNSLLNAITALTGDVTAAGPGSAAATIAAGAVDESKMATSDVTTLNASTSKHGLAPKGTTGTSQYWRQDWTLATPAGSGDTYAYVSGSNATTTSLTAVDITGMSITLDASSSYILESHISGGTSSAAGVKHGIAFSGAAGATPEGGIEYWGEATSAWVRVSSLPGLSGAITSTLPELRSDFYLFLRTGVNSGNLTMQHLKITSGTSTVYIGSYMKVTKVA